MRTKNQLYEFDDIRVFYQYLYLSKDNKIEIKHNFLHFELFMTDDLHVMIKNLNFPEIEPTKYDMLFPTQLFGMIDILKNTAPLMYCTNRWEEIKGAVACDLGLNKAR